ncbi:3-keto-5-aminohexanoate cleavage protein [Paraburkholderia pallida]|uniref:3-keto-5-aminohexanoate cleavage protein n=1 Tax=Paraburkholderia pallida TaxID=2547399 RepID=A0A4P7D765_9BURK|nr:3-keto-5-aminohexanoate cleavage protein [Paraburkholderia pallida]QBR04038.1 3-keto-5-aminohexanoate cleavage protein [Paraburkholderia pallida]HKU00830.1 3-keto-5-aminohexanoate cleavage protein [Paraburkholderia sp.]
MNFLDGHLFPENQQPLIITAAPYAPSWVPSDFPEDIPVTMEEQIQKAVDCYNAGATVLHLHVRELDGKGSKRLSKFNELIAGVRARVPEMIIQVGGSISFAPETEGAAAKWLSDDTRHMLAELDPKPDQVTVTINTSQMNFLEQFDARDIKGTSMEDPVVFNAYKEMTVPAQPGWAEEHIRRLTAAGIQSEFQCYNINSFESVERLMRRGIYRGPLVLNWVAIGGGMDAPNIYSLANFVRAVPDGAVLTVESSVLNVLPVNMMGIAMGLHVRTGTEDNLWNQSRTARIGTVAQIEQLVDIARIFGRPIATAKQAREICKIGVFYDTVEETLAANGFAPNRNGGQQGYLRKIA